MVARGVAVAAFVTLAARGALPARRIPSADDRTILVRVTDAASGRALQNAEVLDRETGSRRLTDELGEARLTTDAARTTHLRVRQIGYRFAERDLPPRAGGASGGVDTLAVTLSRVAVILPEAVSRAVSSCDAAGDSTSRALSLRALEQLRFGAEQYESFKRAYPFRVDVLRRSVVVSAEGRPRRAVDEHFRTHSKDWGDPYRPGRVLRDDGPGFYASILFISTLADSTFWERHCLTARRIESLQGNRVLPLEFSPAPGQHDPDWAGTAFLDSATSVLRRVNFQLAGIGDRSRPRRLEGYITFVYPSPFVVRPDSVVAAWWNRDPDDGSTWGAPSVVQLVRAEKVEYLKGTPPDSSGVATKP